MTRSLALVLCAASFVTPAFASDPPTPTGELHAIQGNWKPTALKFEDADTMPADMLKQVTGVYDGGEFHLYFVDRTPEGPRPLKLMVAKVAFDETTSPKSVTFECDRGQLKGRKLHGIYERTGDTLRLCYGPVERPKPTSFTAPKDSGCFCESWQRQVK